MTSGETDPTIDEIVGRAQQDPIMEGEPIATANGPCESPTPSIVNSASPCTDPIDCTSDPTPSAVNLDSDYIPDLEPLPFDAEQDEPLVECGDIVLVDDDEDKANLPYPDHCPSLVLPTYTSSAVALMTTMKPQDSLLGSLRFSSASRSAAPFLRQPYRMNTSGMSWMDFCQGH